MAVAREPKPVSLCIVSIGYGLDLLMTSDKGLKLVELLQHAKGAEQDLADYRARVYHVKDMPDVEYRAIKHTQIRATSPAPAKPVKGQTLLLGND